MTEAEFATLALSLPEAVASSHFGVGDFRVRNKIFAGPGEGRAGLAILKLTPDQQDMMCAAEPAMFAAAPGAWGLKGWTRFDVAAADPATAESALWTAWRNVAPKSLAKLHP